MSQNTMSPTMKALIAASKTARQSGNFPSILQQAQATYRDLMGAYGLPAGGAGDRASLMEQADLSSATSGILNKVFGRSMWVQVNQSNNAYGHLPKTQVRRGVPYGWRAKTAFGSSAKGGQTEGTVPTAVAPSYSEVAPTIKEHSTQMRITGMQQDLAEGPDDAYGMLADIVSELAVEHAREFERAITTDIDTAAGVHLESLDRVSASSANQAAIGWTAGDEDIYGIDRSASTWADAVQTVSVAGATITTAAIDAILRQVHQNGGNTVAILTGWDTWANLSQLFEPRGRFDLRYSAAAGPGVGGIASPEGAAISTFINEYQGRPILASDLVVADASELSRLYFEDISNPEGYDKPRLGVDVLRPTQMYMAGERSGTTPQSIGFVGDSVLAVTRHELGCRFFKAQGQLRDRTAA